MTNMYETWLMEQIHSIANFPYEDIKMDRLQLTGQIF